MDCGAPPELENGRFTVDPPTSTVFDSMVTYECDENFTFEDSTMVSRTCQASGDWSDEDIKCSKFHIDEKKFKLFPNETDTCVLYCCVHPMSQPVQVATNFYLW